MKMNNTLAEMVKGFLLDNEIMTEKVRSQIQKALEINNHLTSCYSLQVAEVQDIHGNNCKDSGWYINLSGTRCGVKFFVNNDMEITRKPNKNKCEVVKTYSLYNHIEFSECFWSKYF